MHIHILGICGTFMGGLAIIARQLGHRVTGSDANVYPPMSTQLEAHGIELFEGYDPQQLKPAPDLVVVGNAMSRGNPAVEAMLEQGLPYSSGPQWLAEHLLRDCWVLACAGTHGKTTTSSMLAWILEYAGMKPGYLIGGVPSNFGVSARRGDSPFFVIEADEYDSAFFDKRSKFVHYGPRTLILNNLEYDHADIFPDLEAIQRQFHHLLRVVPGNGQIILPDNEPHLDQVLAMGCWTPVAHTSLDASVSSEWQARLASDDGSRFEVIHLGKSAGSVTWYLTGRHNVSNALAAIAAARHVGVTPAVAIEALQQFKGVKRRMELLAEVQNIAIYDDFAHHPTAIATTLEGLRARLPEQRIFAVIEPRSNTMRLGVHRQLLAPSTQCADRVLWYQPEGMDWSLDEVVAADRDRSELHRSVDSVIERLVAEARGGDQIVIMSNGGFEGIHQRLIAALEAAPNSIIG